MIFWTDLKRFMRLVSFKVTKTTQLFKKHNGVLALLYVTMMLIWLGVIFRENFMKISWPWCVVIFPETFTALALSVCAKLVSLNLFVKVRDEVQNVFVKSFQSRIKWAIGSVEDQCKTQKTNSIERKTSAERLQNRIIGDGANMQLRRQHRSGRNARETINPTISQLWCCEKLSWTQTRRC